MRKLFGNSNPLSARNGWYNAKLLMLTRLLTQIKQSTTSVVYPLEITRDPITISQEVLRCLSETKWKCPVVALKA